VRLVAIQQSPPIFNVDISIRFSRTKRHETDIGKTHFNDNFCTEADAGESKVEDRVVPEADPGTMEGSDDL